ncbi:alpha/beta fold hydrolase [Hamadaea tsunoensis]|uniref:alpha/beta fold hydrolase n=1 Tax=Hamadaea tsunoensis TaxID=53368 RepID=UPI0004297496|nr:alpha/beta hydrolase [Hamadaea tsunoensis]
MAYAKQTVAVGGGELAVGVWGETGPLVVAVHGITSNHLAWTLVGEDLGRDHRFVAVDLRGRGDSRDLPGPYGMARHAEDVAAVIEAFGGGPIVLAGQSMGGWVTVETAHRRPDLVERLVLVDGGAPLPLPDGVPARASEADLRSAVEQTVGTAFARLTMTFPDVESAVSLWRGHPALTEWTPLLQAYAEYDVTPAGDGVATKAVLAAAVRDAQELYALAGTEPRALPVPGVFLRAEFGMLGGLPAMYAPGDATHWLPGVAESTIDDVNHYTVLMGERGAKAVIAAIRGAAAA